MAKLGTIGDIGFVPSSSLLHIYFFTTGIHISKNCCETKEECEQDDALGAVSKGERSDEIYPVLCVII